MTKLQPGQGSGACGYAWNPTLFPNPRKFCADLHSRKLKLALNLHPQEGMRAIDPNYASFATAINKDPASGDQLHFDMTDPKWVEAYFKAVHHPIEDHDGVDFWWVDYPPETISNIAALDPLWVLAVYHYLDSARRQRPMILSRFSGPGAHRYPMGFSGVSRGEPLCQY